ncbi:trypsin-like serine peptidase [Spirillospora sp. NPDC048911]|uniref:trypsin-like serine peptidase n=1 Tax=Spirillospora sp. NPDC048911 TaxID=3364527 RepID=UPI0037211681
MLKGRKRVTAAVVASTGVVAAGAGAVAYARHDPATRTVGTVSSVEISATDAGAAEQYWTAQRLAKATPVAQKDGASGQATVLAARSKAFGGVPSIGALFFNNGQGDHYCTASVVNSYSKKLLITAAHCLHGGKGGRYATKIAFVPKYDKGKRPYGTWTAKRLVVPQRWSKYGDADLDFGFISLNPRSGKKIQNVVGANSLSINKGVGRKVNVAGYPRIVWDRRDRPIYCVTTTRKQSRYQLRMDCSGFHGGTSGSPWLLNYNTRTRTGSINGVIGGYQGGGNVHYISYSPYFDKDVYNLRSWTDKHA